MKPPSKHGLERKYKPWRKGKSSSEKATRAGVGGNVKRPTNASLKNLLRGQKRLLAKLERGDAGNKEEMIDGAKQRIAQLERDILAYEVKEREKKNSTKYHKVKFIERQKMTRLEKSVKRQIHQLEQESKGRAEEQTQEEISQLHGKLESIAMDQLYIAYYPANMKYMALFANGTERVVDDERGQKRRRGVWKQIREGLLQESIDRDNEESQDQSTKKASKLSNTKKWVAFDVAKKALLSLPTDTYPNASYNEDRKTLNSSTRRKSKTKATDQQPNSHDDAGKKTKEKIVTSSDSRFALSTDLDGLFHESTTGEDYRKEVVQNEGGTDSQGRHDDSDSDSSSDNNNADSSSEDDDADPLKALSNFKKDGSPSNPPVTSKQKDNSTASSSSSSSSSDSDSDSDSETSESESDDDSPHVRKRNMPEPVEEEQDSDDDEDDFFAPESKITAEDIFTKVQNDNDQKKRNRGFEDEMNQERNRRPDKSKGFHSQNQSKRDYRAFQSRQKRQKFG